MPVWRFAIALGLLALVACAGPPQAPTPIGSVPTSAAVPQTPSPSPSGSSPNDTGALVGLYSLTLEIGSGCAVIPEAARSRKYTANIDSSGDGRYIVTLSDATFLTGPICTAGTRQFSGIGCHQFFASVDGDTVNFVLENNDEAHGGHIVEQSSSGAWMEIIGAAAGKLRAPTIEASGTSSVWYCATPSSYPFPCSNFVSCGSVDMRLTLTRK